MPFADWVPAAAKKAAGKLSEEEAVRQLDKVKETLPLLGPVRKRPKRTRKANNKS